MLTMLSRRAVSRLALGLVAGLSLTAPARAIDVFDLAPDRADLIRTAPNPAAIARIPPGYEFAEPGFFTFANTASGGPPLSGMSDAGLQAEARAAGIADIGFVWDPSAEALVAARPDLIIGSAFAAEGRQELLGRIAPTALLTGVDWRDYYRTLARLTGREDRLDALLAPLDARIAALRARMPATTVSVLRITPWDFQVYPQGPGAWAPFALMQEAGVRRTDYETAEDATMPLRPDWEELGRLEGDILLTIIGGTNDSATSGRWEEVTSNPLWQMLPAVRAGRVHPLSPATWMEFSGVRAANRVLDDLERLVIGAP